MDEVLHEMNLAHGSTECTIYRADRGSESNTKGEGGTAVLEVYNPERSWPVDEGQVFKDTRPEEIARVHGNIRKNRLRERVKNRALPQEVHVRVVRIIGDRAVIISVEDPVAAFHLVDQRFLKEMLATGAWIERRREPVAVVRLGDNLTASQRRSRERNMAILAPVIALGDQMFKEGELS